MKPDLSDPAERLAYRRELRSLYPVRRRVAVGLLVIGGVGLVLTRLLWKGSGLLEQLSWLAIGAGAAACVFVIILRTRYHRRRMAQ